MQRVFTFCWSLLECQHSAKWSSPNLVNSFFLRFRSNELRPKRCEPNAIIHFAPSNAHCVHFVIPCRKRFFSINIFPWKTYDFNINCTLHNRRPYKTSMTFLAIAVSDFVRNVKDSLFTNAATFLSLVGLKFMLTYSANDSQHSISKARSECLIKFNLRFIVTDQTLH